MESDVCAKLTLSSAFEHACNEHARETALICDGETRRFDELYASANALAGNLQASGVAAGDRVALLMTNGIPYVVAYFGIALAGGTIAPMDVRWTQPEVARALRETGVTSVIASPQAPRRNVVEVLDACRSEAPDVRRFIVDDKEPPSWAVRLDDLCRTPAPRVTPRSRPDGVAAVFYTSGASGLPKGVLHSDQGLLACVESLRRTHSDFFSGSISKRVTRVAKLVWRYRMRVVRQAVGKQVWMTPLALHSIAGNTLMLQTLLTGQTLVTMNYFHPRLTMRLIGEHRVTTLALNPTMAELLLKLSDFETYDTTSLLVVGMGGSLASPTLARRVKERFGCALAIGYGTTELGGGVLATHIDDSDEVQTSTVGRPFPGAEVRIVDGAHCELPANEVGELACRVEGMMVGYGEHVGDGVSADGWYYTGDLATMDERGNVRVVGRKRDVIIRSGQNIFPSEVEELLARGSAVDRCAVVGVPVGLAGERIWAFVVAEPGDTVDTKELLAQCRANLAAYKIPDHIELINELPYAGDGKVQSHVLRARALDLIRAAEHVSNAAMREDEDPT